MPVSETDTCVYSVSTSSALPSDSGQWRCEVTNDYGRSAADFSVKILNKKNIECSEPPKFTSTFDNQLVDEEDNATFKCEFAGRPLPEVKWFRDEIPIEEGRPGNEQYKIFEREGTYSLKIKRARMRDSAVYKCKISNVAGWASCDAKLYVKEGKGLEVFSYNKLHEYSLVDQIKARRASNDDCKNEADTLVRFYDSDTISKFLLKWDIDADKTLGFVEHLKSKCSVEGSFAALSCLVKGEPPFKVRWYKNNKEIFEGRKYFIKSKGGIQSLEIPLTQEDDTANYMCEVRNHQGKIYSSCYLQCEPTLEITNEVPTKPIFVKPLKRLTVDEGEIIRFRVTVKGYPAPGFKWYKDGLEIHDSDRITTEMMPNGVAQLVIERSTVRDIGLYTCEAHNLAGRCKSMVRISVRDKFEIDQWKARSLGGAEVKTEGKYDLPETSVKGPELPKINYIPNKKSEEYTFKPIFNHRLPHNLTIRNKGRFMMECCCNAIPRPKVQWLKDGKRIQEGPRYNFLNLGDWFGLELTEGEITDSGKYTVKLVNERGEATSDCEVEMKLPTEEPRKVNMPIESALEVYKRSDRQVAQQTEEVSLFQYADIVPSCHLCNSERDWTAFIEREVEVLEAEESPSFPDALPDKITPLDGAENITLTCKVQGNPIPRVVWFKDDKVLDEDYAGVDVSFDMEARTALLTIKKLTEHETGKYTCVAYKENGGHATTTTEVSLREVLHEVDEVSKVLHEVDEVDEVSNAATSDAAAAGIDAASMSLPEFKVKLEDTSAAVGSQLKLEVVAEGCPKPQVQWFKNEQQIEPTLERYSLENSSEGGHALVISSVHVSDGDCFKCVAVNECGMVSSSAHVVVQEQCVASEAGERPSLKEPLHSVVTKQGGEAVFRCVATGKPVPTLTWLKDSTKVEDNSRIAVTCNDGEGTLTIKNVSISDAGLYICVAENEEGKVESSSTLQVIADPNAASESQGADGTTTQGSAGAAGSGANNDNANGATGQHSTANVPGVNEPAGGGSPVAIKEFDFLKRPKFVARPISQWVVADDELYLSVKVVEERHTTVNWFHNGEKVQRGRFRFETKYMSE